MATVKVWMKEVFFRALRIIIDSQGGKMMKNNKTRKMVYIAFLSAMSAVLFMFEFPIMPPLQMDLSDLPVIIATVTMGWIPGICVALLKNLLHIIFISKNPMIAGEIANFLYAVCILAPFAIYKPQIKHGFNKIVFATISVVLAAVVMNVLNYYITFPLFHLSKNGAWEILFATYFPFNLVKGGILFALYYLIEPYLHRIKL